jgi:Tfp pilus assembly protein PilX
MTRRHRQHGAALLVSLIMLVILTLFVVSSINMSSVNLKIVGNEQAQKAMEAAAQQAIERTITQTDFASPPDPTVATSVSINPSTVNAASVSVQVAECDGSTAVSGFTMVAGALPGGGPQMTHWDIKATVQDANTGANVEVHQGVKVQLPATCN